MADKKLQKPALRSSADDLPIEVLDPLHSAQYYSLKMYEPAQELALFVDHYWIMRWELPAGASFTAEVIPSPYINLTFMSEGSQITGVTTGKYTYDVHGKGTIVGAKFHPGGYYGLSGVGASEVTDKVVPAETSFPLATGELSRQALAARTDQQAIVIIEKTLLAQPPKHEDNVKLVQAIISGIKQKDHLTVAVLAEAYDMSERRLQELFQTYVGVSLKWVLLRYRLLAATQLALQPTSQKWTEIAAELGYSDQAHFINDFKRIIEQTPGEYAKGARL